MPTDQFPSTARTWITQALAEGTSRAAEVRRHLMEVYAFPLRVYFLGCSYHRLGEPDEIINGFFADRLARNDFLPAWQQSNLRLRRWLMNALLFYLKEQARAQKRDRADALDDDQPPPSSDDHHAPESAAEAAFARNAVKLALAKAHEECNARGLQKHWDLFHAYHLGGQSCKSLAGDHDITAGQAWVKIRTVQRWFIASLRHLMGQDGVPEEQFEAEIRDLLRTLAHAPPE